MILRIMAQPRVRRANCIGPQYHKIKRVMMAVNYNFEWDIKKAQANQDKHGVSFEKAAAEP